MVKQIIEYACGICGETFFDREDAREHEKIKLKKPLPVGFVYRDRFRSRFHVYSTSLYKIILPKKVKFTKLNHTPIQAVIELEEGRSLGEGLHSRGFDYLNDDQFGVWETSRGFDEDCYTLNKEEFKKFKKSYSSEVNKKIRKKVRLEAKDLTNKL